MENNYLSLKATIQFFNFPRQFCLEIINGLNATGSREVSLNENVYYFSVDCNSLDKYDILSIHKYIMSKNNVKQCPTLLSKCLLYYWVLAAL